MFADLPLLCHVAQLVSEASRIHLIHNIWKRSEVIFIIMSILCRYGAELKKVNEKFNANLTADCKKRYRVSGLKDLYEYLSDPEAEPELCGFLRKNDIPACDFVKNQACSYVPTDNAGRIFTLQRYLPGRTLAWNTVSDTILMESAELLGKIHFVLQDYPSLSDGIGV